MSRGVEEAVEDVIIIKSEFRTSAEAKSPKCLPRFLRSCFSRLVTKETAASMDSAKEEGVVVWQQGEATATTALTHPRMFEFFPGIKYEEYAFRHMASASVVVLVYNQATHSKLMLPWLRCALTEACINPIGAQDSGCR